MLALIPVLVSLALWLRGLSTGEKWAYGAAFVVLIGVVGETVADLTKWIKDEDIRKLVEKASALVLILGLTGDLIAIRLTQSEMAELSKEAGDAKISAKQAADEAQRAKELAAQVGVMAGIAQGEAIAAGTLANAAEGEARSVEKQAGELQAKLSKLAKDEKDLTGAFVDVTTVRKVPDGLVEALKLLPPKKAEIWFTDAGPEPYWFANKIWSALKEAQWDVKDPIPKPQSQFNWNPFRPMGCELFRSTHTSQPPTVPSGLNENIVNFAKFALNGDLTAAALSTYLRAQPVVTDPAVASDTFVIVVGPREIIPF